MAALLAVAISLTCLSSHAEAQGLAVGYYTNSCPTVETIIYNSMRDSYTRDPTTAPGVLRLAFHDCFVRVSSNSIVVSLSVNYVLPSNMKYALTSSTEHVTTL